VSARKAANRQQQEILLRFQAGLLRRNVPFLQEAPDAVPQLSQRPVFAFGDPFCHDLILS
jgi:hypothetical protein